MDSFLVLSEADVHALLIDLTREEIIHVQHELAKSLMDVSTGGERTYQPDASFVNRPNGQRTLFRPFTSPTSVGAKLVVEPAPSSTGERPPLHGILALCDNQGIPTGLMSAEEVTGLRTSLSALIPYMWRRDTENILVFGAGVQALWHIRLALALRGDEIKTVTVVNRSEARVRTLFGQIQSENQEKWASKCSFHYICSGSDGYDEQLKNRLSDVDAIFCTVPSTEPLFPLAWVTGNRQGSRQPFVSAVGSWQRDMIELDPAILRHVVSMDSSSPSGGKRGAVLVDDRGSSLKNSGEVYQSRLAGEQLLELGEILSERQRLGSASASQEHSKECLEYGFVVFKSVGVSVTDLTAGNAILDMARKKNVGNALRMV